MSSSFASKIESRMFPFVERPIRYIGNEVNIVRKDLTTVSLHGILCFPEVYDIGMSHFGLQVLYHRVNSRSQWALSRCFHPFHDAECIMRKEKIPLYCLEYHTPLSDADWVGFSVQYELQFTNIVNMLDLGNIPLFSKDRDERHPVILAGGPCMINPEPIADFIDAFAIGDGEETIVALCACMEEMKRRKTSRSSLLKALAEIPGVYVPAFFPVQKRGRFSTPDPAQPAIRAAKISGLRDDYYPVKPLVPLISVVHHRLAVEVMRGCTRGCRFCSAGSYYRPVRERETQAILDQMDRALASTGWCELGLLSLSTGDYSHLTELLRMLPPFSRRRRIDVSMPSTRVDSLTSEQTELLDSIGGTSSFTLAPEAGSLRLRRVINKDFSDQAIISVVEKLMQRNVQTLKLYFMIGLPTETPEDIAALIRLIDEIADMVWKRSRRRTVNVSLSPFSPKAQTPFQWERMDSMDSLIRKYHTVKQAFGRRRNIKISCHDPAMTFLETVMARGDRRVSALVHLAWRHGARSDGWTECFNFDLWRAAAEEGSIDMQPYVDAIPLDQPLSWSAVTTGITGDFLRRERDRAMDGTVTADCRTNLCQECGVCDFKKVTRVIASVASGSDQKQAPALCGVASENRTDYYHYRIVYTKKRLMRFLGHRDMMNIFHRAFLGSPVPVAFTKGFHPNPRMSFGLPLSFGVAGEAELFDVTTTDPVDLKTVVSANVLLPSGLEILGCSRILPGDGPLNIIIEAGLYLFSPLFDSSQNDCSRIIERSLARKEIIVKLAADPDHPVQNRIKDIRPLFKGLRAVEETGRFGIEAVLALLPKATCRPSEFIAGIFPDRRFEEFTITRTQCLRRIGECLVPVVAPKP